jgi:hypothetical protein
MPAEALRAIQIVGTGTVTVIKQTAYIYGITIACHSGAQVLHIQDKGSPPKVLVPTFTMSPEPDLSTDPPNPRILEWTNGKVMDGGIDVIVTAGTGTVSVWIDYQAAPPGSGI